MVVRRDLRVVSGRRAGVADLVHEPELHQLLQRAVHSRARNLGVGLPNPFADLFRRGVIRTPQDRPEDQLPLEREIQPVFLEKALRILRPPATQGYLALRHGRDNIATATMLQVLSRDAILAPLRCILR